DKIDVVFHQAAYGGYMPAITKVVHVNSLGTAQMLEAIREKNLPVKKVVVASSQAVYSEGAGDCPQHGLAFPSVRPVEQLRKGDWQGALPTLRRGHDKRSDSGKCAGRWRNRLRPDESRSRATGPPMGQTARYSHCRAALLLHIRTAPIDL